MREIKFRGLRRDNETWVEGDLLHKRNSVWIGMWYKPEKNYVYKEIEVIPETVRQYIGIDDKNGKEIYEGDIVEYIKLGHRNIIIINDIRNIPTQITALIELSQNDG